MYGRHASSTSTSQEEMYGFTFKAPWLVWEEWRPGEFPWLRPRERCGEGVAYLARQGVGGCAVHSI